MKARVLVDRLGSGAVVQVEVEVEIARERNDDRHSVRREWMLVWSAAPWNQAEVPETPTEIGNVLVEEIIRLDQQVQQMMDHMSMSVEGRKILENIIMDRCHQRTVDEENS